MIALRPGVSSAVRLGLSKHVPVSISRPLSIGVRAYKGDAKQEQQPKEEQKHEQEDQQVVKHEAAAHVAPRSLHPAARLPSLFHEMQREMDAMSRMFGLPSMDMDPFFLRPPAMLANKLELPSMSVAVDVEEDDKAFVIKADTPGIPKESLKLKVLDGTLTISGERQEEKREEGGEGKAPLRYERSYGSFTRSFSLPPHVDVAAISAEAQDGVLTVIIPKLPEEKPQPKEIEIK